MTDRKARVGVAGMTHLGIISAAAIASKGFETVCYDPDAALISRLDVGDFPVTEPGLIELGGTNGPRQSFASKRENLAACDVVYIAPDVPTNDQGESDLTGVRGLIQSVAEALSPRATLVILCQVPPGFTRSLEVMPHDRLYYQVETLIFGRAVERALLPERYIVGCADPAAPMPPALAEVLGAFGCPILPMRYESAELAKISINMCLVASIGVANTLAELCEATGAVWSEIVPSLKLDARIGPASYLKPGLGIAGGNLERDLATVIRLADRHGTDAGVVKAWIANSRHRRDWATRTIERVLLKEKPNAVLAIWGLAYKENTHSTKNSPSLATLAQLPAKARLQVFDPVVPASAVTHPGAAAAGGALAALERADALLILTPWPEFRSIEPAEIASRLAGRIVLDPYAILDPDKAEAAGLIYYTLGRPALNLIARE